MSAPTLPERVQTLEDEVAGLESMLDARARELWTELQKLHAKVKELTDAKTPDASACRVREGGKWQE